MGLLVFKTSAPVTSWLVGSIPMHFRHLFDIKGLWGMIGVVNFTDQTLKPHQCLSDVVNLGLNWGYSNSLP